jgi:hypothetical protein
MRKIVTSMLLLLLPDLLIAQSSGKILKKLGPHPLMIVDSVRINDEQLAKINANDIATVTVMIDTNATKIYGDAAKDGVVICETKTFARKQYIAYLRSKSKTYDSLYMVAKSDSTFQYIVNDKPEFQNYEGDLTLINNGNFISIDIITADDLKNKYNIPDKAYGIIIKYRAH